MMYIKNIKKIIDTYQIYPLLLTFGNLKEECFLAKIVSKET